MSPGLQISEVQADLFNDDLATAQTIDLMCQHIHAAIEDPEVQALAFQIAAGLDPQRAAAAVWQWAHDNIEFVQDEVQLWNMLRRRNERELLIAPSVMVRTDKKRGDCDCFVMSICALLLCCSLTPLIKTFKCDRLEPKRWAHVCSAVKLDDGSIMPLDASHGDYPGWEVPAQDVYQWQLWDMDGNPIEGDGNMVLRKGLRGYVADPTWTGSPMTAGGPFVSGYPTLDLMAFYNGTAARIRGLQGIARGKYRRGMGDDGTDSTLTTGMLDQILGSGAPGTYGPSTLDPNAGTPLMIDGTTGAITTSTGTPVTSSAGIPLNWNSIIASLGTDATKLGAQALATPGTTILPNGTIVAGTPQGTSALTAATGLSTGTLMLLGIGLFAALLLSKK